MGENERRTSKGKRSRTCAVEKVEVNSGNGAVGTPSGTTV